MAPYDIVKIDENTSALVVDDHSMLVLKEVPDYELIDDTYEVIDNVKDVLASTTRWEFEKDLAGFRHRIVTDNEESEWVGFRKIAILGRYRACSKYYEFVFPVEKVFVIREV